MVNCLYLQLVRSLIDVINVALACSPGDPLFVAMANQRCCITKDDALQSALVICNGMRFLCPHRAMSPLHRPHWASLTHY